MWSCGYNAHLNGANLHVDVLKRLFLNWVASIFLVFQVQNVNIRKFSRFIYLCKPKTQVDRNYFTDFR